MLYIPTFRAFFVIYIAFIGYASIYSRNVMNVPNKIKENLATTTHDQICSAFSLPDNWIRLSTITDSVESGKMRTFHGVRVFILTLVIFSHTFRLNTMGPIANTNAIESVRSSCLNNYVISTS